METQSYHGTTVTIKICRGIQGKMNTSKSGEYWRGNKLCRLFFTGKGYVYVVSLKSIGEVVQDFKKFSMDVGETDDPIYDDALVLNKIPDK